MGSMHDIRQETQAFLCYSDEIWTVWICKMHVTVYDLFHYKSEHFSL